MSQKANSGEVDGKPTVSVASQPGNCTYGRSRHLCRLLF
ncbi:hypothetical protein yrohd0001_9260 [Yersinia rohdei ATCC 43380]|nr:hypothetical protein yrohd0001_9260 [Yersinia rohdei ATCC 43380]